MNTALSSLTVCLESLSASCLIDQQHHVKKQALNTLVTLRWAWYASTYCAQLHQGGVGEYEWLQGVSQ